MQNRAHPERDTFLPAAAGELEVIARLRGKGDRQLRRCPACDAYFRWVEEYEFLMTGSEDEQTIERISDEEAALLAREEADG
jgi:hypothetical protein